MALAAGAEDRRRELIPLFWHEDPLGELASDALCMHCGRGLWSRPWGWADWDGSVVCVRAGLTSDKHVHHEPMPAGLRGAPAA